LQKDRNVKNELKMLNGHVFNFTIAEYFLGLLLALNIINKGSLV
jgi:hypothetical protein